MIMIDAKNWYWSVGGSADHVYSSARNIYVPIADAAYQAWSTVNTAIPVASEVDLWGVLQARLVVPMPDWMFNGASFVQPAEGVYSVDQLTAYTASVRYDHEIAGTIVGGIQVRTDRESQGMINGAYNMAARDASFSTQWKTTTGAFMTLDAATIIAVAQAVGAHVAACFAKEAATVAAISAGSITTLAQVDAAFA